jgi:hypothetical protein
MRPISGLSELSRSVTTHVRTAACCSGAAPRGCSSGAQDRCRTSGHRSARGPRRRRGREKRPPRLKPDFLGNERARAGARAGTRDPARGLDSRDPHSHRNLAGLAASTACRSRCSRRRRRGWRKRKKTGSRGQNLRASAKKENHRGVAFLGGRDRRLPSARTIRISGDDIVPPSTRHGSGAVSNPCPND